MKAKLVVSKLLVFIAIYMVFSKFMKILLFFFSQILLAAGLEREEARCLLAGWLVGWLCWISGWLARRLALLGDWLAG